MENKTFKLYLKSWKTGGVFNTNEPREGCLGKGRTKLLNEFNYLCCLGQFICQAVPEDSNYKEILNISSPEHLFSFHTIEKGIKLPELLPEEVKELFLIEPHSADYPIDSSLSHSLMEINDCVYSETTIEERIKEIRNLLEERGYKLEVIDDYMPGIPKPI